MLMRHDGNKLEFLIITKDQVDVCKCTTSKPECILASWAN